MAVISISLLQMLKKSRHTIDLPTLNDQQLKKALLSLLLLIPTNTTLVIPDLQITFKLTLYPLESVVN